MIALECICGARDEVPVIPAKPVICWQPGCGREMAPYTLPAWMTVPPLTPPSKGNASV